MVPRSGSAWRSTAFTATASLVGTMITAAVLVAAPAVAQSEPDTEYSTGTGQSLSFRELGLGTDVSLPGRTTTVTLTLPVPDGLTPTELRGTLQVPAAFSRGVLEVLQDGRLLGSAELTDSGDSDIRVPLDGLTVSGGTAAIQLRTTLIPVDDGWCHDPLDTVTSILRDASLGVTGEAGAPETLADTLPPVLHALTVIVPDNPDSSVVAAALETTTAVAAIYSSQHPEIRVVARSDAADVAEADAFTRIIDIPGDGDSGVTLENPGTPEARTVFQGTGDGLLDQARLFTSGTADDLAGLLDTTTADARSIPVELAPEAQSLADIGVTDLSASGDGVVSVTFGIDQGSLGRLVDGVDLRLSGSFTPLPMDSPGEITVTINDTVVDRASTADSTDLSS